MISVKDALEILIEHRPHREVTSMPLSDAAGRVLASDVVAQVSKPPASVSAMDGYAVRLEDVRAQGRRLEVIGEAPAGRPFSGTVEPGKAVRIFTGAIVPKGSDHIVIQEDVVRTGDIIECQLAYDESRHIRTEGLDFSASDIILKTGTRLSAFDLALAASANHCALPVYKPQNVAILSNGDELKLPGSELNPGDVVSSNPTALVALLNEWGADAVDLGIASDTPEDIQQKIKSSPKSCDIIVAVGGASVGDHDHMRSAFLDSGFSMIFEKIAVRPGKPTWFAKSESQLVLGLPGNPASAIVCANLFLKPLVYASNKLRLVTAKSTGSIPKNGSRESYLRAVAALNENAELVVETHDNQDSSLITPLSDANCVVRRAPNAEPTNVGELVELLFLPSNSYQRI